MSVGFVVLCHGPSRQVVRLVEALAPHRVVVRHDASWGSLDPEVTKVAKVLSNRAPMPWGSWEFVEGILEGCRDLDTDWVVTLSGQDYLIRPVSQLEAWLDGLDADAVLTRHPEVDPSTRGLSDVVHDDGPSRYRYHTVPVPRWVVPYMHRVGRFQSFLRVSARPRGLRPLAFYRVPMRGVNPVKGYNWFALRRPAVDVVLAADRRTVKHFRRTYSPAEGFFHTILWNSSLRIVEDYLHYERWEGGASPAVLTLGDLPTVISSQKWFARKIDDPEVLDVLDMARNK
jgi:hypothetical protein